jgi:hypothetical protein
VYCSKVYGILFCAPCTNAIPYPHNDLAFGIWRKRRAVPQSNLARLSVSHRIEPHRVQAAQVSLLGQLSLPLASGHSVIGLDAKLQIPYPNTRKFSCIYNHSSGSSASWYCKKHNFYKELQFDLEFWRFLGCRAVARCCVIHTPHAKAEM